MSEIGNLMMSVLLAAGTSGGGTGGTGGTTTTGGGFIAEFFNGVAKYVKSVGSYVVVLIGVALIIVSVYMLVKALVSRGGANWLVIAGCLLVGGIFAIGGWTAITGTDKNQLGGLGKATMDTLSEGSTKIADFKESGTGSSSLQTARKALYAISSGFILPFGKALAICTGVALILLAVIEIAKYFFAGGRMQTSWLKLGAMCLIGSVLFATTSAGGSEGWDWAKNVLGGGTKDTIINMANGKATDASPIEAASFGENGNATGADPTDVPT